MGCGRSMTVRFSVALQPWPEGMSDSPVTWLQTLSHWLQATLTVERWLVSDSWTLLYIWMSNQMNGKKPIYLNPPCVMHLYSMEKIHLTDGRMWHSLRNYNSSCVNVIKSRKPSQHEIFFWKITIFFFFFSNRCQPLMYLPLCPNKPIIQSNFNVSYNLHC